MNNDQIKSITWEAYEHTHREKSSDWYWSLGIIVLTASFLAIIFGNYIFGVLLVVMGVTLGIAGSKHPKLIVFELNKMGIRIDNKLFPYATLETFWVEDNEEHDRMSQLLIQSRRTMVPLLVIPLDGVETHEIRDFLLYNLLEKEMSESLSHIILERLGF
jgi:hypothetical protein